jgi:DNA-binding response OmpR family regulator
MPDQFSTSQVIRFATFEVDLQAQELRKGGLRLKLSGQPFQVLAILLEQPGVVVTRSYKNGCGRTPSLTSITI